MKMKNLLMVAIMLLGIGIASCSKPEKGDKGDVGPAGTNGTNGTNGQDGNANVTSVLLNANTWTWDNTNYWSYATWSGVSILTSDIATSGAVMLYEGSGTNWMAVPYSFNIGGGLSYYTTFEYNTGTVTAIKAISDDSNPTPSAATFKLVCISSAMVKEKPNVNLRDYQEVAKAFNLSE